MIRPLRVTEIRRAVAERVRGDGEPCGGVQVGGGLNHDGDVRRPGDDETEPIGLEAKTGAAAQDQWGRKNP